ncbi:MAG: hypothetical protein ACPLRW_07275 [Moorellales bacterium]
MGIEFDPTKYHRPQHAGYRYNRKVTAARQDYTCAECGQVIPKGAQHLSYRVPEYEGWAGRPSGYHAIRLCLECAGVRAE